MPLQVRSEDMAAALLGCAAAEEQVLLDIFAVHVIPKLQAQDVQALRQTCTALRQLVASGDGRSLSFSIQCSWLIQPHLNRR